MTSPYQNIPVSKWPKITKKLIDEHPLKRAEIVEVVLDAWNYIVGTKLGDKYVIGIDINPKPQIMGFFLHELIALELAARYPKKWRSELTASDKDIVYIPDDLFSVEVKTSSNTSHIYGNRSYAQIGVDGKAKKSKTGYYLAINFEKFKEGAGPRVLLVRFGWLDHKDWVGQIAATGQQSRLSNETERGKLELLYRAE